MPRPKRAGHQHSPPQIFGTSYMHAQGIRNSNQILHGDQIRREESFLYRSPRMLTRDLFAAANLFKKSYHIFKLRLCSLVCSSTELIPSKMLFEQWSQRWSKFNRVHCNGTLSLVFPYILLPLYCFTYHRKISLNVQLLLMILSDECKSVQCCIKPNQPFEGTRGIQFRE